MMKADFAKAQKQMSDEVQMIQQQSDIKLREQLIPLKEQNAELKMELRAAQLKSQITEQVANAIPQEKEEKEEKQPAQPMNVVVNLPSGSKVITMPDGRTARVDDLPPEVQ